MSPSSLAWHDPAALALLVAVAPFLVWLARRERQRAAALRFPLAGLFKPGPRGLSRLWWLPHALRLAAIALAIVALARPQEPGSRARDLSVEGIDIVVALDVSTSMNAADFRPRDRITVAKEVLRAFIEGRTNDRIGLVVFAGDAYTQSPLTLDYHVLTGILGSVKTGLIEDGTAIGNALATSINRLCEPPPAGTRPSGHCQGGAKSKVLILITDGDSNAGNISPMEAAAIAADYHIRVFTIMVGRGGRVPFPSGKDFFGQETFTEVELPVNRELLEAIAQQTGGSFYNAVDRGSLEGGLNDILDQLERSRIFEAGSYQNMTERFQPLLLVAALLAIAEAILSATRLRSFP